MIGSKRVLGDPSQNHYFEKKSNELNSSEEKPQEPRHPAIKYPINFPAISLEALKSFQAVSDSIQRYAEQNQQIMQELAKAADFQKMINPRVIPDVLKILDSQRRLIDFNKILSSPAFELATAANQSIERLLAADTARFAYNEMISQSAIQSRIWKEQQDNIDRIAKGLSQQDLLWRTHFVDISKFALLSQTALSRIAWEQIGNSVNVEEATRQALRSVFLGFSQSYSRLFASFEKQPSIIASLPPIISKLPAVEFFNGVTIIEKITDSAEEDAEFESEQRIATEETRKETGDRLEALLRELDAELIIPLQGARESLNSENPDRIRHFAASLRELFTHVLHTLAPANRVKEWSTAPEYYDDKGRPTRRVRLLYICRVLNQEPFSKFVEKDIDTVLEFLQLFQQGTHEVMSKFTDFQLAIMLVRMESTLRFILEIWRAG
jgi:hypothetical protein